MKKVLLTFGLAALVIATGSASAEVKMSVAGLQVVDDGYKVEGEKGSAELRAFNWHRGTRVALLFKSEGKSIVKLDEKGSKLSVFGDGEGTDFMKAKSRFSSKPYRFERSDASSDGKALLTTVETEGVPKRGAASIVMEGEASILMASKSELKKSKKVALKKGSKFVVGEHRFEILSVKKPDWGDDALQIELQSKVSHEDFKSIKFYDGEGKENESNQNGSSAMGMFGKKTYTVTFSLKRKVKNLTMGLDTWTDLEVVKVPFSLKVGAGL